MGILFLSAPEGVLSSSTSFESLRDGLRPTRRVRDSTSHQSPPPGYAVLDSLRRRINAVYTVCTTY